MDCRADSLESRVCSRGIAYKGKVVDMFRESSRYLIHRYCDSRVMNIGDDIWLVGTHLNVICGRLNLII